MLVVDTSAVVAALVGDAAEAGSLRARLREAASLHAPHLLDTEVLHALRGLARGAKLGPGTAWDVWQDFTALPVTRYPLSGLADRVWGLRHTLTAYDATFLALAEALECPLVTRDRALAAVPDARVPVILQ